MTVEIHAKLITLLAEVDDSRAACATSFGKGWRIG